MTLMNLALVRLLLRAICPANKSLTIVTAYLPTLSAGQSVMVTNIIVPILIAIVLIITISLIPGSFVWKIVGILSIIVLALTVWSMLNNRPIF